MPVLLYTLLLKNARRREILGWQKCCSIVTQSMVGVLVVRIPGEIWRRGSGRHDIGARAGDWLEIMDRPLSSSSMVWARNFPRDYYSRQVAPGGDVGCKMSAAGHACGGACYATSDRCWAFAPPVLRVGYLDDASALRLPLLTLTFCLPARSKEAGCPRSPRHAAFLSPG